MKIISPLCMMNEGSPETPNMYAMFKSLFATMSIIHLGCLHFLVIMKSKKVKLFIWMVQKALGLLHFYFEPYETDKYIILIKYGWISYSIKQLL